MDGPQGPHPQNFGDRQNEISGHTVQDSFEAEALDAVCVSFAERATQDCGEDPIIGAGCQVEETFTVGSGNPLPDSEVLSVSGTCTNGTLPNRTYVPRLRLTCRLEN